MSKRGELLKAMSEKGLTWETRLRCSGMFPRLSEGEKENLAGRLVDLLDACETEEEFVEKLDTIMKSTATEGLVRMLPG